MSKANLTMALPPGWAAMDKEALVEAIDDGFFGADAAEDGLLSRLRSAETHLIAFSQNPVSGKPQAVLTATVLDDPRNATGVDDDDKSEEWQVREWTSEGTGEEATLVRAARTVPMDAADELGVVAITEVRFEQQAPGAVVTTIMKFHNELVEDALGLVDDIAETVSVAPLT